jgi:hypothetical protein
MVQRFEAKGQQGGATSGSKQQATAVPTTTTAVAIVSGSTLHVHVRFFSILPIAD